MNRQRGRAYRIRQKQRKKHEAYKRATENGWNTSPKSVGLMATTPAMCSAECCGNVRKHSGNSKCGKTQQELVADSMSKEVFNNLLDNWNVGKDPTLV